MSRKIRLGFVSNSSSSSFVIAYPKNYEDLHSYKSSLEQIVPKFLDDVFGEICRTLDSNVGQTITEPVPVTDDDEWEYYPLESATKVNELIDRGLKVCMGSVSDDDGGMGAYLHYSDINYASDKLIVKIGE